VITARWRELTKEFGRMNEAYREWQIESVANGASLRAYFPGTEPRG
jgi:hypothetical protein